MYITSLKHLSHLLLIDTIYHITAGYTFTPTLQATTRSPTYKSTRAPIITFSPSRSPTTVLTQTKMTQVAIYFILLVCIFL